MNLTQFLECITGRAAPPAPPARPVHQPPTRIEDELLANTDALAQRSKDLRQQVEAQQAWLDSFLATPSPTNRPTSRG